MKESKDDRKTRQQREEWQLVECLRRAGNLVEPEHPVCPERRWRVDYLLNRLRQFGHPVALEIQGFGFGHVGRTGWLRDIEKAGAIAANGWRYVPVTREMVASGDALEVLAAAGVRVEVDPVPLGILNAYIESQDRTTPIMDSIVAKDGKYARQKMRFHKLKETP